MKFSLLNFDQSFSKTFELLYEGFQWILGANKNCGRWSEIVAVRFPDIISLESIFQKILSMRVFEWLVSIVGCKINGIIKLEAKKSRKSLEDWCTL